MDIIFFSSLIIFVFIFIAFNFVLSRGLFCSGVCRWSCMIGNYHVQFFREDESFWLVLTLLQLMQLGWKSFLPLAVGLVVFSVGLLVFFDGLPNDFYFNLICLF